MYVYGKLKLTANEVSVLIVAILGVNVDTGNCAGEFFFYLITL